MIQRLFAIVLTLSALVTAFLGARTLFDPVGMMVAFGAETDLAGVELLMAVLGAAIVSLGVIKALAARWVFAGRAEGRALGLLCGAGLLLVATCAWFLAASMQVLLLDGVRGGVLLLLGIAWKPAD